MATIEKEFMGSRSSKMWTYLILLVVLILGAILANVAFSNPTLARDGIDTFVGLPAWALAAVAFVVGLVIYWLGLKVETDWPEAIGAFLIAGSVVAAELIVGWNCFALGGIIVLPYVIPILVFAVLLMIGMKRSV